MLPLQQLLNTLLDVFLPPLCHICRSFIPNSDVLHICPTCSEKLPIMASPLCSVCGIPFSGAGQDHRCGNCLTHPPHYDRAWSAFLYKDSIRDLIHSFKYDRTTHLSHPLALMTVGRMNGLLDSCEPEVIVPVPLHRSRLRQRGFNQAILLGNKISRRLSLPMYVDALTRTRPTKPQISLSVAERALNVRDAFTLRRADLVDGKQVLLLDDVMTTGSTMNECARVLKKGGATAVIAATVARTPL